MSQRFEVREPTNTAGLVTLNERPWFWCPRHDERIAKDEFYFAWCPSCAAEDRAEDEARHAPITEARVRKIVREMLASMEKGEEKSGRVLS